MDLLLFRTSSLYGRTECRTCMKMQQRSFVVSLCTSFSQNTHKDTYFHIKNYTPLCNSCQPFAQIQDAKFYIFVALYRLSEAILCILLGFFQIRIQIPFDFNFSPNIPGFFTGLSHGHGILIPGSFAILTIFSYGFKSAFIHFF